MAGGGKARVATLMGRGITTSHLVVFTFVKPPGKSDDLMAWASSFDSDEP